MCIKSSVSEGVAEGRGSNMSVKIPCAWLAAVAQSCSLRSRRMARFARFIMSHRNHGNHRKLLASLVNGLASLAGGMVRSAGRERGFLLRC